MRITLNPQAERELLELLALHSPSTSPSHVVGLAITEMHKHLIHKCPPSEAIHDHQSKNLQLL
jgi:hypothetical protein